MQEQKLFHENIGLCGAQRIVI